MYHLVELLQQSKVVISLVILKSVQDESGQFFSAKATLVDSSFLFVRESFISGSRGYAYHWQTQDSRLICRWDNAPHHPDVKTQPHHKHQGSED